MYTVFYRCMINTALFFVMVKNEDKFVSSFITVRLLQLHVHTTLRLNDRYVMCIMDDGRMDVYVMCASQVTLPAGQSDIESVH